jgi:hypothetical protein
MKYSIIKFICILFILSVYSCNKINGPYEGTGPTSQINNLNNYSVSSLCVNGNNIFAGTGNNGLFLSANYGLSWILLSTNFFAKYSEPTTHYLAFYRSINSIINNGNNLFVGIGFGPFGGVFLSTDNGSTWNERDSGLIYQNSSWESFIPCINCFANIGNNLFAGTNNGVYLSSDNGINWKPANANMQNQVVRLAVIGNDLFAGTTGEGVFLSTNNGNSWTAVNSGLTNSNIYGLASIGTNLFAGAFQSPGDSTGGIFLSTNKGISWKNTLNTGLTSKLIDVLFANGNNLYAGTNSGLFRSTNQGTSWVLIDSSLFISLATDGSNLIAGGNGVKRLPL